MRKSDGTHLNTVATQIISTVVGRGHCGERIRRPEANVVRLVVYYVKFVFS